MKPTFREKLYDVIFEHDTPSGKFFDLALILCIILSVLVVMLDTVKTINTEHGELLYTLEWFFTLIFTAEYLLRLYCIESPLLYARSFYGIIDLLSIMPTYFSLLFPGSQYLLVIRVLRVLRIFRVLKFVQYVGEANMLLYALRQSRRKIFVFLFTVLNLVVILGSLMYLIEAESGTDFTSIPISIYWAIVTLTTVGYGDISPMTPWGQMLAAFIMILGYSIIAVPTGLLTAELNRARKKSLSERVCHVCSAEGHDEDALYCKYCGEKLQS